jgi:hypothetical protein
MCVSLRHLATQLEKSKHFFDYLKLAFHEAEKLVDYWESLIGNLLNDTSCYMLGKGMCIKYVTLFLRFKIKWFCIR